MFMSAEKSVLDRAGEIEDEIENEIAESPTVDDSKQRGGGVILLEEATVHRSGYTQYGATKA